MGNDNNDDNDNDNNETYDDDDDNFTADMHWRAEILASTSFTLMSGDEGMMSSRSLMGSSCNLINVVPEEEEKTKKDVQKDITPHSQLEE